MDITWDDYCLIANAVNYDQVSSVSAAYRKLLQFRGALEKVGAITIHTKESEIQISSLSEYDEWVRKTFPGFKDDPLHPIFRQP